LGALVAFSRDRPGVAALIVRRARSIFGQLPSNTDMKTMLKISVLTFLLAIAGCTSTRQDVNRTSLQTPVQVQLGKAGSPLGPIRIRSGQMISLPLCCPPVELCDAKGKRVRELNYTRDPQPLVAGTGTYSIVGHDPAGGECVLRLEVTEK
jgi:hypothetical protein